MTFHLTCVHIILVRFQLLSGHHLENSCSLGGSYVLFCILTIISHFGYEGWIWVLTVSVPDLCILLAKKWPVSSLPHNIRALFFEKIREIRVSFFFSDLKTKSP